MMMMELPTIQETAGCRFQNFFCTSRQGMFTIDPRGRMRNVNHCAAEIFGYDSPERIEGNHINNFDFFFSPEVIERLNRLMYENEPLTVDFLPATNLKGHFAYHRLSCNRSSDVTGEFLGIFGTIEDVSEQYRNQETLKNRLEELSILAQISQVMASALDTEEILKIILTGVTARQGLGFNRAFLFLLDEDNKTMRGRLAIGPANASDAGAIWGQLEHDDRTLVEILEIYSNQWQKNRHDPTEIIRSLEIQVDGDSVFARALSNKETIVVKELIAADKITKGILEKLGETQAAVTPLISRDRPVGLLIVDNAITGAPISDDDCRFLKLIADQTAAAVERSYLYRDLKEHALELENINRKLAETQHQIIEAEKMSVIGEVTAAVAHELRNPLTIIGGFANLMTNNLPPSSPDGEYLNIIVSETQRAEGVLNDVLNFSQASKSQGQMVDLNDLIMKVQEMLSLRLGNGRCRARIAINDRPMRIWGNRDQLTHALYQIFRVLMDDVAIQGRPQVSTHTLGDRCRIEINFSNRQDGCDIQKVLQQYFGVSKSTKRLSLIVAEETLKYHGGMLGVESNSGGCPVLFVELPAYKERADA